MRTGDKSQITVIACCNAAGYAIPPTVVFDRKQIRQELTYGEIPGTYTLQNWKYEFHTKFGMNVILL